MRAKKRVENNSIWHPAFWSDERGQDLVEYSLLLAFIVLVGAAMLIGMGTTTTSLWSIMNARLAAANNTGS